MSSHSRLEKNWFLMPQPKDTQYEASNRNHGTCKTSGSQMLINIHRLLTCYKQICLLIVKFIDPSSLFFFLHAHTWRLEISLQMFNHILNNFNILKCVWVRLMTSRGTTSGHCISHCARTNQNYFIFMYWNTEFFK